MARKTTDAAAPASIDLNAVIKKVTLSNGEITDLSPDEKYAYLVHLAQRAGLDPDTSPFRILVQNKNVKQQNGDWKSFPVEKVYAGREATEQIAANAALSLGITDKKFQNTLCIVSVRVSDKDGRFVDATGAKDIADLAGVKLENAIMHAETKAFRRGILRYKGLGILDESEVVDIEGARSYAITAPVAPEMVTRDAAKKSQSASETESTTIQTAKEQTSPEAVNAPGARTTDAQSASSSQNLDAVISPADLKQVLKDGEEAGWDRGAMSEYICKAFSLDPSKIMSTMTRAHAQAAAEHFKSHPLVKA